MGVKKDKKDGNNNANIIAETSYRAYRTQINYPTLRAGTPFAYTPQELEKKCQQYFDEHDTTARPYSIASLSEFLGIARMTFWNYSKNDEYSNIINRAKNKIIAYLEERCITEGKAGLIFILKNYGYTDQRQIEHVTRHELIDENIIDATFEEID